MGLEPSGLQAEERPSLLAHSRVPTHLFPSPGFTHTRKKKQNQEKTWNLCLELSLQISIPVLALRTQTPPLQPSCAGGA